MTEPKDFERLEMTVKTIATHRDYPGKQVLVREYLDAIEGAGARVVCRSCSGPGSWPCSWRASRDRERPHPPEQTHLRRLRCRLLRRHRQRRKILAQPHRKPIGSRRCDHSGHRRHEPARKGLPNHGGLRIIHAWSH